MRRRPIRAAALAVVLLVVGQLLALVHGASTRHVTCAEHGEELEAPDLGGRQDDGCGQSHLIAVASEGADAHHDCTLARLLRTTGHPTYQTCTALTLESLEITLTVFSTPASHTHELLRVAPKTSPPV